MRASVILPLLICGALLVSCDSAATEPGLCFLGADTEVEGDINVLEITSPSRGDTLRVGQPFRFRAEVESVGDVRETFVQIRQLGLDIDGRTVLFQKDLEPRVGRYVIDQTIVLDSARAGVDRSELYVSGGGRVLINTACGGGFSGGGGAVVPVTVLD